MKQKANEKASVILPRTFYPISHQSYALYNLQNNHLLFVLDAC
jgi:hypothetical protein